MVADGIGQIILVNGTSSSGKTSLIKALQATLPDVALRDDQG